MNVPLQRTGLIAVASAAAAGSALVIAWAFAPIAPIDPALATLPPQTSGDAAGAEEQADGRQLIDPSAARRLRRPLVDPPPPRVAKPAPREKPKPREPKPKLALTLVGTIIEADQRLAIVSDESGNFDIKGPGESLQLEPAGVRVETVDAERVTLQYRGSRSEIELDRSAKPQRAGGSGVRRPGRRR